MKCHVPIFSILLSMSTTCIPLQAQSTAWSYQGHLLDGDQDAAGLFDMTFDLFASEAGGDAVASVTNFNVALANGLFTTTLDFGAAVYDGTDYWLEIGVKPEDESGSTTLSPRQPLSSVPYALHARMAMDVVNPSFLGTTTYSPLELYVYGRRAFRLEASGDRATVNVAAGSP